jgi:hypothetical protein
MDAEVGDVAERWQFCVLNLGGDHAEHRIALMVESRDVPELEVWETRPILSAPRRVEVGEVNWHGAKKS